MIRVHLVNHTHWDREWYFTTMDSLVLSDDIFTNILNELNKYKNLKFCLDGQSSILEDYLEIRPEKEKIVRELVEAGRLEIGPWYTQTDAFFVDQESIIKNLTIGIRDSEKYGRYMKIGYLPDTFGLNSQLPTIFYNSGIKDVIFRRGMKFDEQVDSAYFIWKGLGNKKVNCVNLIAGYGVASYLSSEDNYLEKKLFPIVNKIKEVYPIEDVIIPVGGDQHDIVANLNKIVDDINNISEDEYKISSYETFFNEIEDKFENFPEYEGEFRSPSFHRVHKTIGSIRYDIKRYNFLIEQKLLRRVEPLISISSINGIDISNELLVKAWKKILQGHAHDSMGGCVSDDVAIDILHRMKEANEIADGIENLIVKRLSEQLDLKENEILIFNTDIKEFDGYKTVEFMSSSKNVIMHGVKDYTIIDEVFFEGKDNLLIESNEGDIYVNEPPYYKLKALVKVKLPSMGYKIISFEPSGDNKNKLIDNSDKYIDNNKYKISYNEGKLKLETNKQIIQDFIKFETIGNDGDTYDFSPLQGDEIKLFNLELKSVHKNKNIETMNLYGKFNLPYDLNSRKGLNSKKGYVAIEMVISLVKDSKLIDFKCKIDNRALSYRLRAKIQTDINAKETIASVPFGFIRRDVLEKLPSNWKDSYVEMPIDIEPFDKSVSVEGNNKNISIFAKGIKEYQFSDTSMYITLFSTTSQLGKPNLKYRPGRASGDTTKKGHVNIETPMAELQGEQEFEFALYLGNGNFDEDKTTLLWEEYNSQNIDYQNQSLNKFIRRLDNKIQKRESKKIESREFSLLGIDGDVYYSSFAPSLYDKDCYILRLQNPTNREKSLKFLDNNYIKNWKIVNYVEEECEDQTLYINKYDTLTIKLWL